MQRPLRALKTGIDQISDPEKPEREGTKIN